MIVQLLGGVTQISVITQDSSVDVATTALLTCVAESNISVPDIRWEKDGENISNSSKVII